MNGRFNNMWNEDPGRLDSIIGPRSKQCTGVPTYTTTHRNKNVNVVQIKYLFIVFVLPTKISV